MLAGYGYGTYAFMEKKLFTSKAEDYNKIDVDQLIQRLLERSTIPNEFVFPLGFDQNRSCSLSPNLSPITKRSNLIGNPIYQLERLFCQSP
jgi:hypothetical protein